MKRKSLFNKIISLSIAAVLFLTSTGSAFAEIEPEEVPAVEETVGNMEEAAVSDVPDTEVTDTEAEGTEENETQAEASEELPETSEDDASQDTTDKSSEAENSEKDVVIAGEVEKLTGDDEITIEDPEVPEAGEKKSDEDDSENDPSEEDEDAEKTEEDLEAEEKEEEEECEHELEYTSNEDGTHTVKCSKCDMEEYTETCEYDEQGKCIHCGFQRLPDPVLIYEDEEVIVTVSGAVPENADLKVTPIKKESEETKEEYLQVEESLNQDTLDKDYVIEGFLAYDIFFQDLESGEEVEPSGEVTVSLQYKNEAIPTGANEASDEASRDILVQHLNEDTNSIEELTELGKAELSVTEGNAITAAEFTSDSFSKYVITWVKTEKRTVILNLVNKLESGAELTPGENVRTLNPPVDSTEVNRNISEFVTDNPIDGYTFVNAKYGNKIIKRVTIKYNNPNYTVSFYNNDYVNNNSSNTSTYRVAQLTTSNTNTAINANIDLYYRADTRLIITNIATGDARTDTTTTYEYQVLDGNDRPVANKAYESDKNTASNLKTDAEGKLILAPGETVKFHDLADGKYTITETSISGKYTFENFIVKVFESGTEKAVYSIESNEPRKIEVQLSEANIPSLKFKNCFASTTVTPILGEEISKYIRYVPDENFNDLYELAIKFSGPEEKIVTTINEQETYDVHTKKNVDIVLAIDKSNSMKGANIQYVQNAIANMVSVFMEKTDVDAKWKIVDFGTDAALVSGSWINTEDVNGAFLAEVNSFRDGTNYQAGLEKANEELNADGRENAEKIIIFLTDGEPTQHIKENGEVGGLGNGLSEETYAATMAAAAQVKCDQFYAVGMNLGTVPVYDYRYVEERYMLIFTRWVWKWVEVRTVKGFNLLSELASKVQATKKEAEDVPANKVGELFAGIAGTITTETSGSIISEPTMVYASNVTMKDTLSQYVNIRPGTEFKISVSYGNSEDPVLLEEGGEEPRTPGKIDANGKMEQPAYYYLKDGVTLTATYDKDSKSITLDFPDDYKLDSRYSYSVKMVVEPSDTAYEYYMEHNDNYPEGMVGDAKTDHILAVDKTSEGKAGFFSNETDKEKTYVKYTFKGVAHTEAYPKPVVQVHLINTWEMYKTDDEGNKLGGAEFTLTDTTSEAGLVFIGTSDYSQEGKLNWDLQEGEMIPVGKTYLLKETKIPYGYVGSKGAWLFSLNETNKPTLSVEDETVETAEYTAEVKRNGNRVTYKFTFVNIKMDGEYILPKTGGNGIYRTTLYGIVLMLTSVFLFYKNRKKSKNSY